MQARRIAQAASAWALQDRAVRYWQRVHANPCLLLY